jgi:hypothetical protein
MKLNAWASARRKRKSIVQSHQLRSGTQKALTQSSKAPIEAIPKRLRLRAQDEEVIGRGWRDGRGEGERPRVGSSCGARKHRESAFHVRSIAPRRLASTKQVPKKFTTPTKGRLEWASSVNLAPSVPFPALAPNPPPHPANTVVHVSGPPLPAAQPRPHHHVRPNPRRPPRGPGDASRPVPAWRLEELTWRH